MIKKLKLILVALTVVFMLGAAPAYAAGTSAKCGDTTTEFIACNSTTGTGTIGDLIKIALLVLSVGIGVVAVGGLAYASIIYASARDDQGKVSEARTIIRNIVIGLILYGMTVAIIAWLLPGSVIDTPTASPSPGATPTSTPTSTPNAPS
jgi:hypothetical protein